ncbi:MAG: hypothetical protein JO270_23665 [Acidobacteriaceae bacterium]|nr:hypothetical protein [Acidobacteriaceae bacterium]
MPFTKWHFLFLDGSRIANREFIYNRQVDILTLTGKTGVKSLHTMRLTSVRDFNHFAHLACRLDGNRVPTTRHVHELVQAWKQIRSWSKRAGLLTSGTSGYC